MHFIITFVAFSIFFGVSKAYNPGSPFLTTGDYHTCVHFPNNSTTNCWGSNSAFRFFDTTTPFKQISSGTHHMCGIFAQNDTVGCWFATTTTFSFPRNEIFKSITSGEHRMCGIFLNSTVGCWGTTNLNGQNAAPTNIQFSQITLGWQHTCGIRADNGSAVCWGRNTEGQGNIPPDIAFSQLSAAHHTTCGILFQNATVRCFGSGAWIQFPRRVLQITVGQTFVCGITTTEVFCSSGIAAPLSSLAPFAYITSALLHVCAYTPVRMSVACWGRQSEGQLRNLTLLENGEEEARTLTTPPFFLNLSSGVTTNTMMPSRVLHIEFTSPQQHSLENFTSLVQVNSNTYGRFNFSHNRVPSLLTIPGTTNSLDIRWNGIQHFSTVPPTQGLEEIFFVEGNAMSHLADGFIDPWTQGPLVSPIDLKISPDTQNTAVRFVENRDYFLHHDFSHGQLLQVGSPSTTKPCTVFQSYGRILDLSHNKFRSLQNVSGIVNYFAKCSTTAVNLAWNDIDDIQDIDFYDATFLTYLNVSFNNIRFVTQESFSRYTNLIGADFTGNPILTKDGCPNGTFLEFQNLPAGARVPFCSPCPAGSVCFDATRFPCPTGTYNNNPQASSGCLPCPQGTFNEFTGQTILGCTYCPPGRANSFKGAGSSTNCSSCVAGKYAETIGSATCFDCPRGKYSTMFESFASSQCELCPAGRYGVVAGGSSLESSCQMCPEGFTSFEGSFSAAQCTKQCSPGFFIQNGICAECPIGTFSPNGDECRSCPSGFFSNRTASFLCTACPFPNAYSISGAVSESQCMSCGNVLQVSDDKTKCFAPTTARVLDVAENTILGFDGTFFNESAQPPTTFPSKEKEEDEDGNDESVTSGLFSNLDGNPSMISAMVLVSIAILLPLIGGITRCGENKMPTDMDLFGNNHYWRQNEPIVYKQTVLGSFCTISFFIVVIAIATNLVQQLVDNNVLRTQRLITATEQRTAQINGSISLEIHAHRLDLDISFEEHCPNTTCVIFRDVFPHDREIDISFPWTYQSMRIVAESDFSVLEWRRSALSPIDLLSNISLAATVQPEIHVDKISSPSVSRSGYRLFPVDLNEDGVQNLVTHGIRPSMDVVNLKVSFRRTDYILENVKQERQSWTQLFSSILGASAGIMSIFRISFIYFEHLVKKRGKKQMLTQKESSIVLKNNPICSTNV